MTEAQLAVLAAEVEASERSVTQYFKAAWIGLAELLVLFAGFVTPEYIGVFLVFLGFGIQ